MASHSSELGTGKISQLLLKQSVPAAIGILTLSIYMIVDTIFVGRWVGGTGIGAITVVMPITFLISSIGMAIGIGGASIISRALGADNEEKAYHTFGNQVVLTLILSMIFVVLGYTVQEPILKLFGGKGAETLLLAKEYFNILILGVPFLGIAMMSNNVIRAEGKPKVALLVMMVPAIVNLVLDPILIIGFDMGIKGAAWATTLAYMMCASYAIYHFLSGNSEIKINPKYFKLKGEIVGEIASLGGITLARQGTISVLAIVLNNGLFNYGGEGYIAIYGIIQRLTMFALFPVMGVTQGFIPIAGFNYGAKKYGRVKEVIRTAIIGGTGIALIVYTAILVFSTSLVGIFTEETFLLETAPRALRITFLATPVILLQLVSSAYFQAIGKAVPALLLTLTKQGFFLIPLVLLLPMKYGIDGIWYAFPIADVLAATVTFLYLRREISQDKYRIEV